MGHADDSVHGGADFVAHIGQEVGLHICSALGYLLGAKDFLFGPFALGDIPEGNHDTNQFPALLDRGSGIFHWYGGAVFTPQYLVIDISQDTVFGRNIHRAILFWKVRAVGIGIVNQRVKRFACQLLIRITQHFSPGTVDKRDNAGGIKPHDPVIDGAEYQAAALLCLFEGFPAFLKGTALFYEGFLLCLQLFCLFFEDTCLFGKTVVVVLQFVAAGDQLLFRCGKGLCLSLTIFEQSLCLDIAGEYLHVHGQDWQQGVKKLRVFHRKWGYRTKLNHGHDLVVLHHGYNQDGMDAEFAKSEGCVDIVIGRKNQGDRSFVHSGLTDQPLPNGKVVKVDVCITGIPALALQESVFFIVDVEGTVDQSHDCRQPGSKRIANVLKGRTSLNSL
ncbi:hypothetical protein MBAV_003852 [Candidatus Magnetobacterium bavaricum]|uniref:Uncharacterized protein n=1 Tax=Candidatus Magnetobacterium bavaricum TaxID=29290 RepID=A0A0F3GTF5_9BACT|nr:hypothetical protein MBAV_003852 [Candidatus Magnetobacterium bavaricum]